MRLSLNIPRAPAFYLALGLCLLTPATAQADEGAPFPGLRALMDDQQFERSGLSRLTSAERAALNRWLAAHADFELAVVAAPAKQPSASPSASPERPATKVVAKRISRKKRAAKETISTRIAGKFTGWTGKTIFLLENGQFWRQRQKGRYFYRADSPAVELFKNRLGFWEMRIVATGKQVKVSRYYR